MKSELRETIVNDQMGALIDQAKTAKPNATKKYPMIRRIFLIVTLIALGFSVFKLSEVTIGGQSVTQTREADDIKDGYSRSAQFQNDLDNFSDLRNLIFWTPSLIPDNNECTKVAPHNKERCHNIETVLSAIIARRAISIRGVPGGERNPTKLSVKPLLNVPTTTGAELLQQIKDKQLSGALINIANGNEQKSRWGIRSYESKENVSDQQLMSFLQTGPVVSNLCQPLQTWRNYSSGVIRRATRIDPKKDICKNVLIMGAAESTSRSKNSAAGGRVWIIRTSDKHWGFNGQGSVSDYHSEGYGVGGIRTSISYPIVGTEDLRC